MTTEELAAAFERHTDEFLRFERIEAPLHPRPDICAFLMLDRAVPGKVGSKADMVAVAEHDEIWLDVVPNALAEVATDEMIRDLHRCGVRYDTSTDSLAMFV